MTTKFSHICILIWILALILPACGKSAGDFQETASPTIITPTRAEPTETPKPPTATPTFTPTATASVTPIVLGEEYRCEAGGFAFKQIPGYELKELYDYVALFGRDVSPNLINIILFGDINPGGLTSEQYFGEQIKKLTEAQLSNQRSFTVGGFPGITTDVTGTGNSEGVSGQLAVVATPEQVFSMLGSAPIEIWQGNLEPYFAAVLASVHLFAPIKETGPHEKVSPASLPPGSFAFQVSGAGAENFIVNMFIDHAPNPSEYALSLVDPTKGYTTTFYLPFEIAPGQVTFKPYTMNAPQISPSASITIGDRDYLAEGGEMNIDSMNNETITGSFEFIARRQDSADRVAVIGIFNQIALK